jgi:hypothetical protein
MGRYAFFSTGLEYKFGFATQESSDIRLFGGVITTTKQDLKFGKFSHLWNLQKDGPYILDRLKEIIADTDIQLPDFAKFSPNLDGTHDLRVWFCDNGRKLYEWLSSECDEFELGCLIYHQLLYEPDLSVGYEV